MKVLSGVLLGACMGAFSAAALADWESSLLPRDYSAAADLETALRKAAASGKSVILYYTRTNCAPCRVLQSHLRREEIKAAYAPHYVFTAAWGNGMATRMRKEYRTRYNVLGAPTWIFYDRRGRYLCTSIRGFADHEAGLKLHRRVQANLDADPAPHPDGPRACHDLPT